MLIKLNVIIVNFHKLLSKSFLTTCENVSKPRNTPQIVFDDNVPIESPDEAVVIDKS